MHPRTAESEAANSLVRMNGGEYFDRIWRSVPVGVTPERFVLRREFLLRRVDTGARVLDVGCGEGAFTAALAEHGADATGVDVSGEALRRARVAHPELDLRLVEVGAPLPFADRSFDVVWAGEVLEHVFDVVALLDEIARVLIRGGLLLASTPNHPRLGILRLALSPRAFAEHFDPRSDHVRFFNARSLRDLLADSGFDRVTIDAAAGVPPARPILFATARRTPR